MMQAIVQDIKTKHNYHAMLPMDVEDLRALFMETFGSCGAQNDNDFLVLVLSTEGYEEEVELSLSEANTICRRAAQAETEHGEDALNAFFEVYSVKDIKSIDEFTFHTSREAYMDSLYNTYSLYDIPFLWGTIDMFLDDDDIFEQVMMNGSVYEANNGVIVEGEL